MYGIFLTSLLLGAISAYFTLRSSDEITSLTGAFTLVCWLVSLWTAPWELQLLIIVLVVATARYYWRQIDAEVEITPENADTLTIDSKDSDPIGPQSKVSTLSRFLSKISFSDSSQRIYRGIRYNTPSKEAENSDFNADIGENLSQPHIYRGVVYQTSAPASLTNQSNTILPKKAPLRYRGLVIENDPSQSQS